LNSTKRKKTGFYDGSREKGSCIGLKLGQGHTSQKSENIALIISKTLKFNIVLIILQYAQVYISKVLLSFYENI
jgi:hypothetical protein